MLKSMYSMLVNIKIAENAGIQPASYKILYIVVFMFGLCSCGSINVNMTTTL
jgi:hypothetical protein